MARTKAVVFDCDGLLLDTEKLWTRGEKAIFAAYGREYTAEHRRLLFGTGVEDTGEILARVLDQPGREKELIEELKELTWDEVAKGARPMPGAAWWSSSHTRASSTACCARTSTCRPA